MVKKLVTLATAFQSDDGGLYETYADAAVDSAGDRILNIVFDTTTTVDTDDIDAYNFAAQELFPEGEQAHHARSLAVFLQAHKAEFRKILRDL